LKIRARRFLLGDAAPAPSPPELPTAGTDTAMATARTPEAAYAGRVAQETARFAVQTVVHDLAPIFHYWANHHLLPMANALGFSGPEDFFAKYLREAAQRSAQPVPRFVSIGSGNCDAEVAVAAELRRRGLERFTLECLDLNPQMIERGRALARAHGLEAHVLPTLCDFNRWQPQGRYDAVLANQSLHHVVELEALFDAIHAALSERGLFITSDIVGRNGHQRWPEALAIVREYWRELPEHYRYNVQLRRHEPSYEDWDCSIEGFEGIRAQDVLPLLVERFGFVVFLAFGNVIDPFIDRSFGPHFDPARDWDRDFIDRVHARDESEMQAGRIKPTHVMAVMTRNRSVTPRVRGNLTPEFCIRRP
jgi:SAM-dependent methyltransferase